MKFVKGLYEYEINKTQQEAKEAVPECKIQQIIEELGDMYDKYEDLNRKTKGKFESRTTAIAEQIGALDLVLQDMSPVEHWKKRYEKEKKDLESE